MSFLINPYAFLAGADFESIATVTVGSGGAADVEFTSISSTYQHLQLRLVARSDAAATGNTGLVLRFNADTGSNYATHLLYGDGSSALASASSSSSSIVAGNIIRDNETASIFSGIVIDVLDYASSTKATTVRCVGAYDANGSGLATLRSGLWTSTNAVTSLKLTLGGGNFKQHSTAALYGIKAP